MPLTDPDRSCAADAGTAYACLGAAAPRGTLDVALTPAYGSRPRRVRVRYAWPGAAGAPTVIVQGGISADRDVCATRPGAAPGWWQDQVGPGAAIDLARCRVLAIDWLDRSDLGADATAVAASDQADALAALLDALAIPRVAAFVGASYGAMVGLSFATRHAHRLDRLVAISGAHRAHPLATALRAIQRDVVRLGLAHGAAREATGLARALAMTTYRGADEFAERFAAAPTWRDGRFRFPVEDYLDAAGAKFAERFAPQRFLALSESIDLHRVDPCELRTPTTLVAVTSDRLVPLADLRELAAASGARLVEIDSKYGHDAFLKEVDAVGAALREALR
jgi:homoserine O-acetyltransferase